MRRLLLKIAGGVLIVLVFVGLVFLVTQMGKKLLGLTEDPRVRVAELGAQAAHDEAEQAYSEYMEVRAEADRLRQQVSLAEEQGENTIRRAVVWGYATHTFAHTALALGLMGVAMLVLAVTFVMGVAMWRDER